MYRNIVCFFSHNMLSFCNKLMETEMELCVWKVIEICRKTVGLFSQNTLSFCGKLTETKVELCVCVFQGISYTSQQYVLQPCWECCPSLHGEFVCLLCLSACWYLSVPPTPHPHQKRWSLVLWRFTVVIIIPNFFFLLQMLYKFYDNYFKKEGMMEINAL